MHVYDIEDALACGDGPELRRAFRLLIDYPQRGHVEGVRLAAKLDGLLDRVTAGLELDQTVMPEDLRHAIERMTGVFLEANASFAQGAIIVFEFRDRWRALHADAVTTAAA